jgi:hypothetical protein
MPNTRGEPQEPGRRHQGPGWQVMAGPDFRFPEVHDGLTKGTTRYCTLHHLLPTYSTAAPFQSKGFAGSSRQEARSLRHTDPRVLKFPGLPFAAPFLRFQQAVTGTSQHVFVRQNVLTVLFCSFWVPRLHFQLVCLWVLTCPHVGILQYIEA